MKTEKETFSIKEKLLQTGLHLFAQYGYEATSTRMIAKEAGVTRSSIAFYFETKEAYYNAVMERALQIVHDFLNPLFEEINAAYANDALRSSDAWNYISRLMHMQIEWFYNEQYTTVVNLIMKEQNSIGHTDMFYSILFEKSVDLLSRLIMTATGLTDRNQSLLTSLSLIGMVQSMGEHRSFTYNVFHLEHPEEKEQFIEKVEAMADRYVRLILEDMMN